MTFVQNAYECILKAPCYFCQHKSMFYLLHRSADQSRSEPLLLTRFFFMVVSLCSLIFIELFFPGFVLRFGASKIHLSPR